MIKQKHFLFWFDYVLISVVYNQKTFLYHMSVFAFCAWSFVFDIHIFVMYIKHFVIVLFKCCKTFSYIHSTLNIYDKHVNMD